MTAQYSCVYGVSENVAGVEDGIAHRMLCKGFSTVLISGTDGLLYWFLVTKMDKKYKAPHIPRYTKDELEAHVGRYLEQEMAPNIRLKTIYDKTTSCHYTPLEEAIYEHWAWKRFACLGDAIHKVSTCITN
jgi:2-polyprenyl-6-methoxyphenol hydroxylase-like FAD-dependent oxidoreductase